jgi:hypothetical protein
MIDIVTEHIRLLAKASPDVPGRPHTSTLVRWALRGVKGIKLETVVIGGRRYTSVEAIERFITRLSMPQASLNTPTNSEERIRQQLDAAGIS